MKRRALLAGLIAAPTTVRAQARPDGKKIGYVYVGPQSNATSRLEIILAGVRASGQALSKDDVVFRVTEGDPAKLDATVKEVLDHKITAFIAGGPATLRAALRLTKTLPILAYDFESDPVAEKYAQSIARPGGNVSGVFLDLPGFAGKWIELLRECMPQLAHVALIWDPTAGRLQADAVTRVAESLGLKTDLLQVGGPGDYAAAFAAARARSAQAVVLLSSPMVFVQVKALGEMAARERMPAITMFGEFARGGGMIGYGPSLFGAFRQASFMAGKVLGGASVATMPIERPSTYEMVVNQRSAETMGIKIPASVQARADELVE
ncbi:MAG TPA: ABC transporter substrate-binding protein [Reyranella sp.]|nr:ABC transporter substrate-binding protein [Reyranella sp.]